jgi:outer membrane protein
MRLRLIAFFFLLLVFKTGYGQDSLNLQQCIDYALTHNTSILRQVSDLDQQSNNYQRAKASTLPTLNGFASQNYNYGRTIDPSTNQFANQQSRANSFSLSGDFLIFGGLRKLNDIRQAEWAKDASSHNLQKTKDDISLNIANQYLQILLLMERQKQLTNQVEDSRTIQKKNKILVDAGAATSSKLYEADAQLATDEANLIDIENQLNTAYLQLKQYLNYDITKEIKVQQINFAAQLAEYGDADLQKALSERIKQMPAVEQAYSARQSAMYGLRSAKGSIYPSLDVNGSLHSVYSSLGKNYSYIANGLEPIGFLGPDTSQVVYAPRLVPTTSDISFRNQLRNNYGQSLGFSLNIPIFNGYQTRYNVQNYKINLSNSELTLTDAETKARNDIYQAYENMKMTAKKLAASESRMKSQEILMKQSELTFNAGAISYFDYSTVKTNYNNAQIDLLQARYQHVFQTKIFEYYIGKPVQF